MRWGVYQLPYKLHGPCEPSDTAPTKWLCGFDHPVWGPKVRALVRVRALAEWHDFKLRHKLQCATRVKAVHFFCVL